MAPAAGRSTLLTRAGPKKQPHQKRVIRMTIITVSPRRKRKAPTQEDAKVTSDDHWAGPGLPLGYALKGRRCDHTHCQEIIDDHTNRLYPTYCSDCLEVWLHEYSETFSTSTKYPVV